MSLDGPLVLGLRWLPPEAGPPDSAGGYRLIVQDNSRRLISHTKDLPPTMASYQLDNMAAKTFVTRASYPGATDVPGLLLAGGQSISVYIAAFNASGAATNGGLLFSCV